MIISIVWLFLQVVFCLALVRFVAFYLSNRRAGELETVRKEAGGLRWAVVRALISAVVADVVALYSTLFLLAPEKTAAGAGTPVIMIHGLYHNRTAWRIMRRRLEKAGHTNLHTYQYNSFTRGFEPAVHGLLRKIDSLTGESGKKVVLMGHSLGGLVARCAAGNPAYADRIAALVTLGSPHRGSELALLGPNRMARDLMPGGHIARTVDQLPDPDCPRLSIHSPTDDYVFPLSMLMVGRDGWAEAVSAPMSHVWMLYSREVNQTVIDFLEGCVGFR